MFQNPLASVSSPVEGRVKAGRSWTGGAAQVNSSNSSGSGSSGSGSSSSSGSSSGSSSESEGGSTCSSREQSPFRSFSEGKSLSEDELYVPRPVEDRDEETRITLEKVGVSISPLSVGYIHF